MKDSDQLDVFGSFIVSTLDHSMSCLRARLYEELNENIKMPKEYRALGEKIKLLSETQKETIEELFGEVIIQQIIWFLLSLEHEKVSGNNRIKVTVDDENVVELSNDLIGELFDMNGWVKKFSEYKNQMNV